MNLLLFEQQELSDSNRLNLAGSDRRSLHIRNILDLHESDTLRIGMINGAMGTGRILKVGEQGVEIDISLGENSQEARKISLILALPRPIMLQRILKQATVLGVSTFHLIRSEKVQKSYFQSNVLQEQNIRSLLLQGLEQAMDTHLPEVHIHKRFKPFIEDVVPSIDAGSLLLAHPEADSTLPDIYRLGVLNKNISLAIGPEGGWNDFEVKSFIDQGGADVFSFGKSILHVDTAVIFLLSQLILLQDLAGV